VFDWKIVVYNLKRIVKPGGITIITTRFYGSIYHGNPFDFWRYEPGDMRRIFADFVIQYLRYGDENIGVWLKAKKPNGWQPSNLDYALYSIAVGKKSLFLTNLFGKNSLRRPRKSRFQKKVILLLRKFGLIM
jgi:hypothetical protein